MAVPTYIVLGARVIDQRHCLTGENCVTRPSPFIYIVDFYLLLFEPLSMTHFLQTLSLSCTQFFFLWLQLRNKLHMLIPLFVLV